MKRINLQYNKMKILQSFDKVYTLYIIGVFLLFPIVNFSQIEIKTDTTKIRIGEQINYKIIVDKSEDIIFPKLQLDSLQHLEVVKDFDIDTVKNKIIKKYTITSFDSGRFAIPPQRIRYKNKTYKTDSIWIDVATVAVDTIKQPLYPIKAVQHATLTLKDYVLNYWYFLFALLWLVIIWYVFFRKKETTEEKYAKLIAKIPPFELAKKQLVELDQKQLWQNNKVKEYYSELTDILRNYIEKELQVPAMESTTIELINELKTDDIWKKLENPKETLTKLNDLLKESDLVKFAKMKPVADEIREHRKETDTILLGLKPIKEEIQENDELNKNETNHDAK